MPASTRATHMIKDDGNAEMFKKLRDIHTNGGYIVKVRRTRVESQEYHKAERLAKMTELDLEIEDFYKNKGK